MENMQFWPVLNVIKSLFLHFYPGAVLRSNEEAIRSLSKYGRIGDLKEIDLSLQVHPDKNLSEYMEKIRTSAKLAVQLYFCVCASDLVEYSGESINGEYYILDFKEMGMRIIPAVFPVEKPKYPIADISEETWERLRNVSETTLCWNAGLGREIITDCTVTYHSPVHTF